MGKKVIYTCEHCGRSLSRHSKIAGMKLCYKHYKQYKRYRKFLDSNQRTQRDPNEIWIVGNIAYMDLYNNKNEVIATAMFDAEDIDKVKDIKWCVNNHGYVTTTATNVPSSSLNRYLLGIGDPNITVSYYDHNVLNNCKSNLEVIICDK